MCQNFPFIEVGLCQNVDNAVVSFVGARFARPKTVFFVSSGRQTLPLQLTIGYAGLVLTHSQFLGYESLDTFMLSRRTLSMWRKLHRHRCGEFLFFLFAVFLNQAIHYSVS